MARSSSFSFIKLKNYLNVCHSNLNIYLGCQSSLNKIPVRYLRRSRYGKDYNQDEIKYQRLIRTLNESKSLNECESKSLNECESKSLKPEADSDENLSTQLQENAPESHPECDPEKETTSGLTPEDIIRKFEQRMFPLKEVTYPRQLEKKYKKSLVILRSLGENLLSLKVPLAMGNDKLPCPLDYVLPSPVLEAYRNKDEFSIGLGLDGNEKTVGYFLDCPTEFSTTFCISPKELSVIRENHKKFAEDFQNYISLSPLPACQDFRDKGYWKNLIVRSNCAGDVMGIVVMHPQDLSQEEIQIEKEKLKDYFSCVPKESYNLQSLYFQTCNQTRCTHEQSPFELLMGDPFIIEETSNMILHISPDSYFQLNTKAAETVFNAIYKICRVNKSTTVLDLCCGVGPISLLFSPRVKKCIGIDDSMQAIIDAKLNAVENRSQNVEFIYGRPEYILRDILDNEYHDELLVVLNSSRHIINKPLIRAVRGFKEIEKVVYIATKPQAALDNFIQLCRPCGTMKQLGKAFLPILALPFDICPHTEQYGLIVMFQRL